MATYEISEPPHTKTCDTYGCGHPATVRVTVPREMTGSSDPVEQDHCCSCWDELRSTLTARGHKIEDTTGTIGEIRAHYPGMNVFRSDEGVLYASVRGSTYDAYLASQLRAQLDVLAGHLPA